jgi:hypothetical protein
LKEAEENPSAAVSSFSVSCTSRRENYNEWTRRLDKLGEMDRRLVWGGALKGTGDAHIA